MRVLLVLAVAGVLALAATAATALDEGPARIRLTASQVEQQQTAAGNARTYALFNRPAYPGRIGTAVETCVVVSTGWLDCTYLLRLGRGVIVARSLVPSAASLRLLAVVGGTGHYANVGGEMTVQPLGGGQLVLVQLLGF